jgi:hypothetical protein
VSGRTPALAAVVVTYRGLDATVLVRDGIANPLP